MSFCFFLSPHSFLLFSSIFGMLSVVLLINKQPPTLLPSLHSSFRYIKDNLVRFNSLYFALACLHAVPHPTSSCELLPLSEVFLPGTEVLGVQFQQQPMATERRTRWRQWLATVFFLPRSSQWTLPRDHHGFWWWCDAIGEEQVPLWTAADIPIEPRWTAIPRPFLVYAFRGIEHWDV